MNVGAAIDRWVARVRAVFTKRALDADFSDELAHHLELQTEENIRLGMAPAEARRQAQLAIGGSEQLRELHREARGLPWLEQSLQDLRYAVRVFRRERGFTVTALLILAVGIGLNTTIFSLVNTVLLRPLPFAEADRLVWITNGDPASSDRALSGITSRLDTWEGLQQTNHTLEQIEAYYPFSILQTYRLTGEGEPETITAVDVSPGLFGMLNVNPLLGRLFLPEDAAQNAPYRTILTYETWKRRYNADAHIVGRSIQINGQYAVEVIGVLPQADPFTSVFFPAVRVDAYSPLHKESVGNNGNTLFVIARTKSGAGLEAVVADLKLAVAQLKQQYPGRPDYYFANVTPLHEWVSASLKRPLRFLWVAAGLMLAIVGFNLGGLLLARGASRRKELALRCALGAERGRVVRQLLMECLALVVAGSVLGGLLAWGFIHFLSVHSSVEIPLLQTLRLDEAALGFTVLLCAVTAVLCGAVPAWKLTRGIDLQNSLNEAGRSSTGGGRRSLTRNTLVILEVALACILTISAGLMVRSFLNLLKVDLGFKPADLIAVRIDPVSAGSHTDYLENVLDRVRAMPGVGHAGVTDCLLVERDRSWGIYPVIPDKPSEQHWSGAHVRVISPGFFAAMGTILVEGRDFTRTDGLDKPQVVIVNQSVVKYFWPGESALGRQVMISYHDKPFTVIGVAADVRHSGPEFESGGEMYLSLPQGAPFSADSWDMLIRTKLPVATLTTDLRNALHGVDATLPFTKVREVQTLVDRTLSSRHLLVSLIGGFAAIAIVLAALGLYGLIAYMVSQQTKEIGIRLALGASPATVQWRIVKHTMSLASYGLILGVGGAIAASRLLQSLLYGVSANDGITYVAALGAVLACTIVAGYIPARRASRIDPIIALRAE